MNKLQENLAKIERLMNNKPDGERLLAVETKIKHENGVLTIEVELECNCLPEERGEGVMEHFWETHTLSIGAGTHSYGIDLSN